MSEVKTDSVVNVSGDNDSGIDLSTNDVVAIKTADSERVRVDASGNVGIGTNSPDTMLHISAASSARLRLQDTTNDVKTDILVGDTSSVIGNVSNHNLEFMTNDVNRMTIESGGDVKIGSHYEFRSNGDFVLPASGFSGGTNSKQLSAAILYSSRDSTSASGHIAFYNANGEVGTITTSSSSTNYNTSSDYRLKEAVVDMTGAIARVKQLAPKRFNFIADPDDTTVDGFLAHEAQTVVPEAISGTHNEVDDDGNAVMQGIDQSKLVPLLTGALKEAIAKIEALEARVTALEDA